MPMLFGNTSSLGSSKNLVEFRAGKMHLRGTTVTADKRKGLLYIYQSDDSLMHFCWKDRTSGTVEDDLIIFPDDIEFKKLPQCTTGRAFILKFKSSTRKFFFWMQEPKDEGDDEYCKKVNELLNNPPAPGTSSSGGGSNQTGLAGLASLGDQLDPNLQNLLHNMDQNQLMQLLGMGGIGGSGGGLLGDDSTSRSSTASSRASRNRESSAPTTSAVQESTPAQSISSVAVTQPTTQTTTSSATSRPAPAVQLSDLQSILSNMQVPAAAAQQESVDLSTSFSNEALLPLMADKEVQNRLKPFLPVVENLPTSQDELRETIQSPQFKQALSIFSAALQSGQLAPLMQQFKLSQPAIDAAAKGDVVGFVKALQEAEMSSSTTDSNDYEDMALD